MARLCVRIKPNGNNVNPELDKWRTQLGDVVCIVEDGHVFSERELNCGQYRFIDVPGVPVEDLLLLVLPSIDANEQSSSIRDLALDFSALISGPWRNRTAATKAQLDTIKIARAR